MGTDTKIEWATHTFNPWEGCQNVGPGCDNCYAEERDVRFTGGSLWGPHASRRRTSAGNWAKPLKWDRDAAASGRRDRVFCASLADVFDNHGSITSGWRGDLWHLISRTPNLDWLLLTKRPGNISDMLPDGYGAPAWGRGWPNVWLGCTVVNQVEADRDIPKLLAVPAKVRFLSMEPLLGPVDLAQATRKALRHPSYLNLNLHWVIVGGESGKLARPMNPQWARDLRDQCQSSGVPYFFKQWGEWVSVSEVAGPGEHFKFPDGRTVRRTGKKLAGRTLDGVEWNEVPAVSVYE